jgi:hypothetical protein
MSGQPFDAAAFFFQGSVSKSSGSMYRSPSWVLFVLRPFAPSALPPIFATTASADFSFTYAPEISPGKVPKPSARAARLYWMRLSVTVGFRGSQHTNRPHPASLPVRVPTVVPLLRASFSLASRRPPCVSLQLSSLSLAIAFRWLVLAHAGHTGSRLACECFRPTWPVLT